MIHGSKQLAILGFLGLALAAACAPAAPSPTAAPPKPAEAKPAAKAEAKPAASPAAKPAAKAEAKPASRFEEVLTKAQQEIAQANGVMYGMYSLRPNEQKDLFEAFQKDFPFVKDFKYEQREGVETQQALLLQLQSGSRPPLDVVYPGTESGGAYIRAGVVTRPPIPWKEAAVGMPSDWGKLDDRSLDPEGYSVASVGTIRGLSSHKSVNPPLKNWEDCLRPEFKDRAVVDPRVKLNALMNDPAYHDWLMKDWLPKYMQLAVPIRGQSDAIQQLASGEKLVACGYNYNSTQRLIAEGAPLGFVVPDPYPIDTTDLMFIATHSKSPHAGVLFTLWRVGNKGQAVMAKSYQELPWYPHGTMAKLLTGGQKGVLCDARCGERSEEFAKEWADAAKLPGR